MSARKTQSPIYSPFEFALQSDMRLAGKPWIITVVLVFVNILDGIKETHGISPLSANLTTANPITTTTTTANPTKTTANQTITAANPTTKTTRLKC